MISCISFSDLQHLVWYSYDFVMREVNTSLILKPSLHRLQVPRCQRCSIARPTSSTCTSSQTSAWPLLASTWSTKSSPSLHLAFPVTLSDFLKGKWIPAFITQLNFVLKLCLEVPCSWVLHKPISMNYIVITFINIDIIFCYIIIS